MGPGVLGVLIHSLAEFGDGGVSVALFHEDVRDPVANHGVAGPQALGLAELRLRALALPLVHQDGTEAHADLGIFRSQPQALAERGGGVFEPARCMKRRAEVSQCEIRSGGERPPRLNRSGSPRCAGRGPDGSSPDRS